MMKELDEIVLKKVVGYLDWKGWGWLLDSKVIKKYLGIMVEVVIVPDITEKTNWILKNFTEFVELYFKEKYPTLWRSVKKK